MTRYKTGYERKGLHHPSIQVNTVTVKCRGHGTLLRLQPVPLDYCLTRFGDHVLPVFRFWCTRAILACSRKM